MKKTRKKRSDISINIASNDNAVRLY